MLIVYYGNKSTNVSMEILKAPSDNDLTLRDNNYYLKLKFNNV